VNRVIESEFCLRCDFWVLVLGWKLLGLLMKFWIFH
jgi:hypothetical protein